MITTWVLIIWFATATNYSYTPTVIEGFTSEKSCQAAAEKFKGEVKKNNYWLKPQAICISK